MLIYRLCLEIACGERYCIDEKKNVCRFLDRFALTGWDENPCRCRIWGKLDYENGVPIRSNECVSCSEIIGAAIDKGGM